MWVQQKGLFAPSSVCRLFTSCLKISWFQFIDVSLTSLAWFSETMGPARSELLLSHLSEGGSRVELVSVNV